MKMRECDREGMWVGTRKALTRPWSDPIEGGWFESAAALESLRAQNPKAVQGEVVENVKYLLSALTPELHLKDPGINGASTRLEVVGLVGQRYELQSSDDMRTWAAVQSVDTTANRFDVEVPGTAAGQRYFRMVWRKR